MIHWHQVVLHSFRSKAKPVDHLLTQKVRRFAVNNHVLVLAKFGGVEYDEGLVLADLVLSLQRAFVPFVKDVNAKFGVHVHWLVGVVGLHQMLKDSPLIITIYTPVDQQFHAPRAKY